MKCLNLSGSYYLKGEFKYSRPGFKISIIKVRICFTLFTYIVRHVLKFIDQMPIKAFAFVFFYVKYFIVYINTVTRWYMFFVYRYGFFFFPHFCNSFYRIGLNTEKNHNNATKVGGLKNMF